MNRQIQWPSVLDLEEMRFPKGGRAHEKVRLQNRALLLFRKCALHCLGGGQVMKGQFQLATASGTEEGSRWQPHLGIARAAV